MKINPKSEFDQLELDEYYKWLDQAHYLIDRGYTNLPSDDPHLLAQMLFNKKNKI